MVAYTAATDFTTNVSASVNLKILIPEPRMGIVHRLNWVHWVGEAASGALLIGDHFYLVEGPVPNEDGRLIDLAATIAATDQAFKALITAHPSGSLRTGDMNEGDNVLNPIIPLPGGIWTVERIYVGFRTAGGVDRMIATVGYEKVAISKTEWRSLLAHSPNTRDADELIT